MNGIEGEIVQHSQSVEFCLSLANSNLSGITIQLTPSMTPILTDNWGGGTKGNDYFDTNNCTGQKVHYLWEQSKDYKRRTESTEYLS